MRCGTTRCCGSNLLSVFDKRLVRIAIEPALAGLPRRDHRMRALPGVLAGVLVRRGVAAKRHAARLTGAKVHPVRADPDALLTFALLGQFDILDLLEMRARRGFHRSTSVPAPSGSIPRAWRRLRTSSSGTPSARRPGFGRCELLRREERTRSTPCRRSTRPRAGPSPPWVRAARAPRTRRRRRPAATCRARIRG